MSGEESVGEKEGKDNFDRTHDQVENDPFGVWEELHRRRRQAASDKGLPPKTDPE